MIRISSVKGVWRLLISVVGFSLVGRTASSSVQRCERNRARGKRHGRRPDGAQARAMAHEVKQGVFLRDLDDETNPFCILTAAEAVGGNLETAVRFGRLLAVASDSSDGPPVTRTGSTDPSCSPPTPPCYNRTRRR
jgi:hypothetical protein